MAHASGAKRQGPTEADIEEARFRAALDERETSQLEEEEQRLRDDEEARFRAALDARDEERELQQTDNAERRMQAWASR